MQCQWTFVRQIHNSFVSVSTCAKYYDNHRSYTAPTFDHTCWPGFSWQLSIVDTHSPYLRLFAFWFNVHHHYVTPARIQEQHTPRIRPACITTAQPTDELPKTDGTCRYKVSTDSDDRFKYVVRYAQAARVYVCSFISFVPSDGGSIWLQTWCFRWPPSPQIALSHQ